MSDTVLRFPQWQEPLLHALMETNREDSKEKIEAVQKLIRERLSELEHIPENETELVALRDAISTLRVVSKGLAKSEGTEPSGSISVDTERR